MPSLGRPLMNQEICSCRAANKQAMWCMARHVEASVLKAAHKKRKKPFVGATGKWNYLNAPGADVHLHQHAPVNKAVRAQALPGQVDGRTYLSAQEIHSGSWKVGLARSVGRDAQSFQEGKWPIVCVHSYYPVVFAKLVSCSTPTLSFGPWSSGIRKVSRRSKRSLCELRTIHDFLLRINLTCSQCPARVFPKTCNSPFA